MELNRIKDTDFQKYLTCKLRAWSMNFRRRAQQVLVAATMLKLRCREERGAVEMMQQGKASPCLKREEMKKYF